MKFLSPENLQQKQLNLHFFLENHGFVAQEARKHIILDDIKNL